MPKIESETTRWQCVPRVLTPEIRDAFWRNMTRDVKDGKPSAVNGVLAYPGCPLAWQLKPEDMP